MTRHRSRSILLRCSLTFTAALFFAGFVLAPGSASAGSLLSGYGGPGGGTQALLGSTLIGGHTSGGGSSGGSSTPGATQASGEGSAASGGGGIASRGGIASGGSAAKGAGGSGTGAATSGNSGAQHNGAHGTKTPGTSAGGSAAYTSKGGSRPAGIVAVSDTSPLGLTGTDVLLLVFVLGVLAITLGLTTRLARMQDHS
ncbi:MAG TPA: hypothetical protein VIC06_13075 [Solirubrobacteraceae bacterium]|jgi:hypothetical protein